MQCQHNSVRDQSRLTHPHGCRQPRPAVSSPRGPLSRVEEGRRPGCAHREILWEAATMLLGMAAFYVMTWMLAAVVR